MFASRRLFDIRRHVSVGKNGVISLSVTITSRLLGRLMSTKSNFRPMIAKYQTVPVTLFRLSKTKKVILREFEDQKKLGNASFDYVARDDGLILPTGDLFEKPNGMSLRPIGTNMWDILANFRGRFDIVVVPADTPIPPELVLWHEHGDHYSMQTSEPVTPAKLNGRLTKFLDGMERISKEDYFERYPIA